MRYFLTLSYDGTPFHGWQVQPNATTVEGELERALATVCRQPLDIVGAGRTDTGVHARMMVAHFDTDTPIDGPQLAYRLNRILPRTIAVREIRQVDEAMHARFSATSRTYHYYIHTAKDPFLEAYSCRMPFELDFKLMNEAAAVLATYRDFGAFCKSHTDVKTTICEVSEAEWRQTSPTTWYFRITANRFLRNMVRAVVGTLIDVGRHRLDVDGFRSVIESGQRTAAGDSMPAHALFLENITY